MTFNTNGKHETSGLDNCVCLRVRSRIASMRALGVRAWSVLGVVVLGVVCVGGSEFPERECCDPVYPPNTATTAAAPVTHPVSKVSGKIIIISTIK